MRSQEMTEQTMQTRDAIASDLPPADSRFENLSVLIDGELSDDMAGLGIRQLSQNEAQLARHHEYIAIGDAMRGLNVQHSDFTQRVMAALEKEPVVLAPVAKKSERRPTLWLAAATAAAITWGIWQSNPRDEINPQLASTQQPAPQTALLSAQLPANQSLEAMPYLAAHQDFAQAVISTQEMRFTKASLEIRQ